MRRLVAGFFASLALLGSGEALGGEPTPTCPEGSVCVPPDDMRVFVELLREKKCLQETKPNLRIDPITVVEDKEGRMFVSGGNPFPYTVHLDWCSYGVEAVGRLNVVVARSVPETYGVRFRLKAAPSYLPLEALTRGDGYDGLDFGVLLEPVYFQSSNLNVYVGVRSLGAGVGLDLTRNLGVYAGYAATLGSWRPNPNVGLSFALW